MTALSSVLETEKYRIIRELGRGGMGVVYLAEDARLKREVALKVLYDHLNKQSSFAERFQEEARSVSTLHHPNIVCVHGLEVEGDTLAIDMEFVEGQSLDQLSASARISPHMAVSIVRDVLSGLVACHQIGIVHRDIKPSNILVALDGAAKLTDFGLATAYASHLEDTVKGNSSAGFFMGTPRYMPPQAWEGGHPEPFWDLYSLGLVLYELITGKLVFSGGNPMEIIKKQFTDPMPDLLPVTRIVSPELVEVLETMLKSASKDATHGAMDILRDLEQTPECKELSDSNGSATITLPPMRRAGVRAGARWRQVWRQLRRHHGLLGWGFASLILVGLLAWWQMGAGPLPVGNEPPDTAASSSKPVPSFADWASGGSAYVEGRLLDVEGVEESGRWQISLDHAGLPQDVLGYTNSGYWLMDVEGSTGKDTWRISGGWARYAQVNSRRMQFGTVEGHLVWEEGSDAMSLSMHCTNEQSKSTHSQQLVLLLKQAHLKSEVFTRPLEAQAGLQNMLYSYLLPRNLGWPERIEAILPSVPDGRLIAPRITDTLEQDGRLEEALWSRDYYYAEGRIGGIAAQSPARGPRLLVRWRDDGVLFGFQDEAQHPGSRFELGILPSMGAGLSSAYQYKAGCDESGLLYRRYIESDRERRWEEEWGFDWEVAMGVGPHGTAVEVFVPKSAIQAVEWADVGVRWRFNARWVKEEGPDDEVLVLAQWGGAAFDELQHGVLLEFAGVSE